MLKIEKTEVVGWEAAIRGMRNPTNSLEQSDSDYRPILCKRCDNCMSYQLEQWGDCEQCEVEKQVESHNGFMVGPNDFELMTRLRNARLWSPEVYADVERLSGHYCSALLVDGVQGVLRRRRVRRQ